MLSTVFVNKKFQHFLNLDLNNLTRPRYQELPYYAFKEKVRKHRYSKHAMFFWGPGKCVYPYCRQRDIANLEIDHIIPVCMAYCLNWTVKETRARENLQLLCKKHHAAKDKYVKIVSMWVNWRCKLRK